MCSCRKEWEKPLPRDVLEMIRRWNPPVNWARRSESDWEEENECWRRRRARRQARVQLGFNRRIVQTLPCICSEGRIEITYGQPINYPNTGKPVRIHYQRGTDKQRREICIMMYKMMGGDHGGDNYEVSADEYHLRSTETSSEESDVSV